MELLTIEIDKLEKIYQDKSDNLLGLQIYLKKIRHETSQYENSIPLIYKMFSGELKILKERIDRIENLINPPKFIFAVSEYHDAVNYVKRLSIRDVLNFSLVNKYCWKVSKIALKIKSKDFFPDDENRCHEDVLQCFQELSKVVSFLSSKKFMTVDEKVSFIRSFPLTGYIDSLFALYNKTSDDYMFTLSLFVYYNLYRGMGDMRGLIGEYKDILVDPRIVAFNADYYELICVYLLTMGANPNAGKKRADILYFATMNKSVKLVNLLFKKGYEVKDKRYHLSLAYETYIMNKCKDTLGIMDILLEETKVQEFYYHGRSLIEKTIELKDYDLLRLFIKHWPSLNGNFHLAAISIDAERFVRNLLKIESSKKKLLYAKDLKKILLKDPHGNIIFQLILCNIIHSKNTNMEFLQSLLEMEIHLQESKFDYHAIHVAAWCNKIDILQLLLETGISVNLKARNGSQPLHYAVKNYNLEMCKFLINHGAEINTPGSGGYTPIIYAFGAYNEKKTSWELIKLLAEHGAETNIIKLLPAIT